ncbi:MurR/RpiR family transcriptional regulator [Spiroplasma endosymbiont of Sarcophaga variegata]|uniref:MurR/RpiR family transcriptional regulator n=1 Tax=Spiroplasma endosymbiont of Sarcophaga variegata TaxID=3066304 RepID=UPI003AF4DF4A
MKIITCDKEKQLTELQIQLIEKLNNDIQSVLELTINELADSLFINTSTLSRLIKKLGFENYSKFKVWVAGKYNNIKEFDIQEDDTTLHNVIDNIYKLHTYALDETYRNLKINQLEQIIDTIHNSNRIVIWGISRHSLICDNLNLHLNVLKYNSTYLSNYYATIQIIETLGSGDLLILVSKSLQDAEYHFLIEIATKRNVQIILLTINKEYKGPPNVQKLTLENTEILNFYVDNHRYVSRLMLINIIFGMLIAKYHPTHNEEYQDYYLAIDEWHEYVKKMK